VGEHRFDDRTQRRLELGRIARSDELQKGLGLRNISERLRQIYNNDAGFDLARQDGRGLRITIDLPKSPTGVMERP